MMVEEAGGPSSKVADLNSRLVEAARVVAGNISTSDSNSLDDLKVEKSDDKATPHQIFTAKVSFLLTIYRASCTNT